jgi:hypothetical protein
MVSGAEPEHCKMHLALIGHVVLTSLPQESIASVKILRDLQGFLPHSCGRHSAHGRSTTTSNLGFTGAERDGTFLMEP